MKIIHKAIIIVCVIWAVSATVLYTVSAATSFTVRIPFIASLISAPSDLKLEAVSFYYDVISDRWPNATVDVKNYDSVGHGGDIFIYLYDASDVQIASGTAITGTISGGVRVARTVVFAWIGTYTVSDYACGDIVISQTS